MKRAKNLRKRVAGSGHAGTCLGDLETHGLNVLLWIGKEGLVGKSMHENSFLKAVLNKGAYMKTKLQCLKL